MKFNEIYTGQFFTIDNTKSYPKLKTKYGYIDVRDEIKKECKDLSFGVSIMSYDDVMHELKINNMDILEEVKDYLLSK